MNFYETIIVGLIFFLCWDTAQFHGVKRWCGIGFPIATLLFIYIMWRAMLTTIFKNGINWRGTHYVGRAKSQQSVELETEKEGGWWWNTHD